MFAINDDFMWTMINDLVNITFDDKLFGTLSKTLSSFNSSVNTQVINVMKNSVFAIGASMLTLFMLMELMATINRSGAEGGGLSSIEIPAKVMLKFGIFVFLYCNLHVLLGAIEAIGAGLSDAVLTNTGATAIDGNTNFGLTAADVSVLSSAINSSGFFSKIGTFLILFIQWVIVHFIITIVNLLLIFRVFELWIMLMFAPIPLATLASGEFRQTALNFLKNFVAICLQGAIICACFRIYQLFVTDYFTGFTAGMAVKDFVSDFLPVNIMYVAALAISVFNSGRIAKSIMNAI